MFIAVDGIDGAGKTTLVGKLADLLKPLDPVATKEPTTNSKWGEKLRRAAIEGRLSKDKEIEYFHKDRMQHIAEVITPALKSGHPVITDRYVDSTLAFQAEDEKEANKLYECFLANILVPDVTFILNCPVNIGLERIRCREHRPLTQYETQETLARARLIYESRHRPNYYHLDATGTAENTFLQAIDVLKGKFYGRNRYFDVLKKYPFETSNLATGYV